MRLTLHAFGAICLVTPPLAALAQEAEPLETRLGDGSRLVCQAHRGIQGSEDREGTVYYGDLQRFQPTDRPFAVLYRPTDDGRSATIWIGGFALALPRFHQTRVPDSVAPESTTFLRTMPEGFILLQFDPWEEGHSRFVWMQRQGPTSSMVHGSCTLRE